jgi:integrase
VSLTWHEVDFRRHVITVRIAYTKHSESRSVQMNNVLTETLRAVRMTALTMAHVFCTLHEGPYRSFRSAFERAVRKAGLVDFTFHDLRHIFAVGSSCTV